MAMEAVEMSSPTRPLNIRLKCTTPSTTDNRRRSIQRGGGQRRKGSSTMATAAKRSETKAIGGIAVTPALATAKFTPQTRATATRPRRSISFIGKLDFPEGYAAARVRRVSPAGGLPIHLQIRMAAFQKRGTATSGSGDAALAGDALIGAVDRRQLVGRDVDEFLGHAFGDQPVRMIVAHQL